MLKIEYCINYYKPVTTCDPYNLFTWWPYDSDEKWSSMSADLIISFCQHYIVSVRRMLTK